MAKGQIISPDEKQKILSLFKAIGDAVKVANIVNRDPAAIRRITKPKSDPMIFNWEDFKNSVI